MDEANKRPYYLPSDAVWFITGCSSGIGEALAQHIARTPNRVVATARNPASLSNIPDTSNVMKLPLDVTSVSSVESALSATPSRFHQLDVVVNNAGYVVTKGESPLERSNTLFKNGAPFYTLIGDTEAAGDAESRALMDTNFWGMVDVTKRALGIMRENNVKNGGQQGGVVLNVSSMGGWFGFPACSFYHASKFAMEGWTEAVAKELPAEWNIHLCNVEPGGVKTKYATSSFKMMEKRHPAYSNPRYPTNALFSYMTDPKSRETWAEPEAIAAAMYQIVSRGERIPIRVPLGSDAWSMIMADIEGVKKELEDMKELSTSVAQVGQARP